jgi:hypothetical protein
LLAAARADKLLALRGQTKETVMNPGHNDNHPDEISVEGAPEEIRLIRPTEEPPRKSTSWRKPVAVDKDTVFRHYTTKDGYENILETQSLWNGFVPYVQLSPGLFKKTFRAVSGLFFTLPKVSGDTVGVPSREFTHYVDVTIPAKMTLLEVEAGAIYLIPLPGRARRWVRDYYTKWARGEGAENTYAKMIADLDKEGGPGPDLRVPVKIVGHGTVR